MSIVKVPNSPFVRDTNSMALMNVDNSSKQEYYEKSRLIVRQKEQINKMNEEIASLKNDLGEIKQLMTQLLSKQ